MKVLTLSTVFPNPCEPTHGTFVFERARHVAKLVKLHVVAPFGWITNTNRNPYQRRRQVQKQDNYNGLPVSRPSFYYTPRIFKPLDGLALFLSILPTVRRLHQQINFDLIDAHFAYPEGFAAALLKGVLKIPLVITERGTLIPFEQTSLSRFRAACWALRKADEVIGVASNLTAKALAVGVPRERVHLIPNGVNAEGFTMIDRREARQRVGWTRDGRLIVSVGHLSPRKGFQEILEILGRLPAETHLAIIGGPGPEGNVGPQLHRRAAELGLSSRLHLIGPRSPNEVAWWMNAADLYILASSYEGCPNVLLEALATGTPVVASRVGEVERFVFPDGNGFLFEANQRESLLAATVHALLKVNWNREAIRASVVTRSWDIVAKEVFEVFQLALQREK